MATKLNLSTPPAEIVKTLQEEFPKSVRWYHKKLGGKEKKESIRQELINTTKTDSFITDIVPYEPPSGNRWITFDYGIKCLESVRFRVATESTVIYETEGSVGCFYPIGDGNNVTGAFIFPSHFFLRYCDDIRQLDTMDGVNTIARFLAKNPFYKDKIYEKNGVKRIYVRFNGCIGLGYVYSEEPLVAEIRTVITDAMMTPQQLEDTKEIREQWLQDMKDEFCPDDKEEEERISTATAVSCKLKDLIKFHLVQSGDYKSEEQVQGYARAFGNFYASTIGTAHRRISDAYTLDPKHIDAFVVNCIFGHYEKCQDKRISTNELMITSHTDTACKILWHLNIDITRNQVLEDILGGDEQLAKYYSNKLNQNNNMNQKAKTQFKNVLSRTGLTKKFNKYSEGIDNNLDRYLDTVESLYAVSRVLPAVADIKDKEKLVNANKMWIQLVIENGFCKELETYTADFGKDLVIKAIHYLIDNDMWASPELNKALKVKQPSNYDGLADIPSAVEYIRDNTVQEPVAEAEPAEETPAVDFAEAEFTPSVENPTELTSKARNAVGMLLQFFNKAQDSINTLNDYYQNADEMETMLYQENSNLQKLIAKTQREKEDLTEQIRISQQKLHEAEAEAKKQEQYAYEARKERATMAQQLNTCQSKLHKVEEDFETLKEKAKTASLPTKKVIPLSELKALPLVGQAVLSTLVPYLERKGCFVDERK